MDSTAGAEPVTHDLEVRMIPIATTRRPRLRAALAALALVAAAACGDSALGSLEGNSPSVPEGPTPYALMAINGKALPVEMYRNASGSVTLTEGELVLGGGTFSQRLTLVETPSVGLASTRASVTQGTIAVSGNKVLFRASDGAEWEGTASPGSVVYSVPGNAGPVTFTFKR
jgi:hypothetical protein